MNRAVAFLPWLRLESAVTCGQFTFVPWHDDSGQLSSRLGSVGPSLATILGAYRDIQGQLIRNCVVVVQAGAAPEWDLVDVDSDALRWATLLLFTATAAENGFGPGNRYVNWTHFTVVLQCFSEPAQQVSLRARRRYGTLRIGGYEHSGIQVSVPPQCHAPDSVEPNLELLSALLAVKDSSLGKRLEGALPYFSLASTDMDAMLMRTELLLLASAIEQLFRKVDGLVGFGEEVGKLLQPWGRVTVEAALVTRPKIVIRDQKQNLKGNLTGSTYAQQRSWCVHRKWAEDLYNARTEAVHRGARADVGWMNAGAPNRMCPRLPATPEGALV